MNVRLRIDVVALEPTPAVVLGRKAGRRPFDKRSLQGIQQVRRAVAAARVPTAGPPFVRYLSLGPRPALEIGLPLDRPHSVPSLRTTILPGGEAASLLHTGPPEELAASLEELGHWVERHAVTAGDPWQWYWTEPDAEALRVQIVWPVRLR